MDVQGNSRIWIACHMRRPLQNGLLLRLTPLLILCSLTESVQAQTRGMVEFYAAGRLQQGLPLVELTHELLVIGRDGWMHAIDPRQPESQVRPLAEPYAPASAPELRNQLQAEFGRDFEVLSTANFIVVQPRGRGERWARLFEQSHRGFVSYMSKRGVRVRQGRFPMIAIVFPDADAMYHEFKRLNIDVTRVAGLYSADSNRVMTHDGGHLEKIATTVRHEAAHQSAFNSGVHSRVNDTPRWISEGVGQMFEPASMTDPQRSNRLADRVNDDCLQYLRREFGEDTSALSEAVMQLVGDDAMFEDPKRIDDAYAVCWAMMFYLAERDPAAFAEILNHTATRPPFQPYTRSQRLRDFEQISDGNVYDFSNRLSRFLRSL